MKRPSLPWNILWITLEDCSPRLGCYGDPLAQTPHMDKLAAEGVRYTQGFSTAPVCAPSRASVITGCEVLTLGVQHMRTGGYSSNFGGQEAYEAVPPPCVKLIPEYFRAAGYFCTNNFKTDYQFRAPLTAWDENHKEAHWKHRPEGAPFFAVWNLTVTHESGMWKEIAGEPTTDPQTVTVPPWLVDGPETRKAIARHYDNVKRADQQVGHLMGELEEAGLTDSTIVMIWSDHGEGLPRAKRWPTDSGTRVPLIVKWPGNQEPGTVSDQLISMMDLGPTAMALAEIPLPRHFQGKVFLGPEAAPPREYCFATRDRFDVFYDKIRSARDARYRYVRHDFPEQTTTLWNPYGLKHEAHHELWKGYREGTLTPDQSALFQASRPPEQLFDTQNDPHELNDIAGDPEHGETLLRMRNALNDWEKQVDAYHNWSERQLRNHFWPGGKQPETAHPHWIPFDDSHRGDEPAHDKVELQSPFRLVLFSAEEGASLAWRTAEDSPDHWRLYTGPISLPAGTHDLTAKAVRIGFAASRENRLQVVVT